MQGHGPVDAICHTVRNHRLSATFWRLFRGLEYQPDPTFELLTIVRQDRCHTQHRCGVNIMPTGVHFSGIAAGKR